jgi:CheY-like chemotaxis protein
MTTPLNLNQDRRILALIVERNPVVQALERFFLEPAGYSVEFAADGVSALGRARELRPTMLITEILVPKMDGLTLCRTLKAEPATRSIIVLVFSHLEAEERALEAGADAFLLKPLSEEHLLQTLRKLLAKHQETLREKP